MSSTEVHLGVDGKPTTIGKERGRPRKTTLELINMREKRSLLKFEDYLKGAINTIENLERMSKDENTTTAMAASAKSALNGYLSLISKVLPDLKATEISGAITHGHMHMPVSSVEMATRIMLWQQEQQKPKVIEQLPTIEDAVILESPDPEKVEHPQLSGQTIEDWL